MNILINCSNLKKGGGLQVADSVCRQLVRFKKHKFIIVLSSYLNGLANDLKDGENIEIVRYTMGKSFRSVVSKRNKFLDEIVGRYNIDCVLTIFGPSWWTPRVPHVSGFARPHIVQRDSPFFKLLGFKEKIKLSFLLAFVEKAFRKSTDYFYTENAYITDLLRKRWPDKCITTITNYYNQVFDHEAKWRKVKLQEFRGVTLLTISAYYPHKNLKIAIEIARILKDKYKDFYFRFIYTIPPTVLTIPQDLKEHFVFLGKVDIEQCPTLYQHADISFQPSLLECFSATYPESMKMGVPIVTADLEFARGLCGDAAIYYPPLDAECAAEQIFRLGTDAELRQRLVANGKRQLECFDNYEQRADKLIAFCERVVQNKVE